MLRWSTSPRMRKLLVLCRSCTTIHDLWNLPAEAPSVADLSQSTTPYKRMSERCSMVTTNRRKAGQIPWSDRESVLTRLLFVQLRNERESAVLLKLVISNHHLCTLPSAALAALECGQAYLIRALHIAQLILPLPPYTYTYHLVTTVIFICYPDARRRNWLAYCSVR
jgi:hypothetical protein